MTDTTSCVRTKPLNEADYGNAADKDQIVVKTRDGIFEVKAKENQAWINNSIFAVTDTDDKPIPHGDAAVGDNDSIVEGLEKQRSVLESENTKLILASGANDTVSKKREEIKTKIKDLTDKIDKIKKGDAAETPADETPDVNGDGEEEKVVEAVYPDGTNAAGAPGDGDGDGEEEEKVVEAVYPDGTNAAAVYPDGSDASAAVNGEKPATHTNLEALDGGKRRKTSKKGHKSTRKGRKSVKKGGKTRKKGRRGKGSRRSKK